MGSGGGGQDEQFPVGMRVLAVDDDPTCLKVLEALLLRCRYHVTTTNQATTAIKLLRENRNKFDLVISDVHMPDMDGFKLLELVGLEMDLPVIMLSVNGETKSVMKGITHGACDYLLKPVRIEELKNIWQHVVRRKFSHGDFGNFDNKEVFENHWSFYNTNGQDLGISELPYQNGSLSRKRKDRNEEDDDDFGENMHEYEDSASYKKPRIVWSIELHHKFVAAVNQLGINKAVPKRILDLMNVEKLTRENVASHLQKYRLYLKRLDTAANQPASMVAACGGRESSYLHRASSGGFENFEVSPASYKLPFLRLLEPSSMLDRANTSAMEFCGHTSSENFQVGNMTNNPNIPTEDLIVSKHVNHQSNQHGILLHGIPASLELEALQPKRVQEECIQLPGSEHSNVTLNDSIVGVTSNPLALQTFQPQTHSKRFINCSPTRKLTVNSDSLHVNDASFSSLPYNARWQCALPVTEYANNNTSLVGSLTNSEYLPKSMDKFPISQGNNNVPSVCSSSIMMPDNPLKGRVEQFQTYSSSGQTMVMPIKVDRVTKFSKFSGLGDSKHRQELAENIINQHAIMLNSCSRSTLCNIFMADPISGKWRLNNSHQEKMIDKNNISAAYANSLNHSKNCNVDKSNSDCLAKDKCSMQTVKLQKETSGSLDDLVRCITKPESNEISLAEYENGIDCYSLGACM